MRCIYMWLLASALLLILSHGAKILAVFPIGIYSHYTLGLGLVKELAARGHEVTFINAFPLKKSIKNVRDISVEEIRHTTNKMKKELYDFNKMSYIKTLLWVTNYGVVYTEKVFNVKEVQKLLRSNETFDLVILNHILNEAMMIFQHKFQCPSIIFAPLPNTVFSNHFLANPSQPAYVLNLLANFKSTVGFWDRVVNVYYDVIGELFVHFVMIPQQNKILQKCVPEAPDLKTILYNSSFMLLSSHISLRAPAPLQPNIKEIGGFHIKPIKPLPEDIKTFLDSAKDGAIIFSMGSNIKTADFPQAKTEFILRVFSKLKQKVLWKFEVDLPQKPRNVMIRKWIPQQDVLAHPNVVAFISHVGLLGMIESVHHGVPILGLPVFWDQGHNINHAVREEFALSIPFHQVTEEKLDWALNELINNPKYRKNVKTFSKIMNDQPIKQIDEAMYWIEYVIRHQGAPHYRSPALNLKWYELLLLDVLVFTGFIVIIILLILYIVIKYSVNFIIRKFVKKSKIE